MSRLAKSLFRRAPAFAASAVLLLAAAAGAHDRPLRFQGLQPGEFVTHELEVPVRIVFIGFDPAAVSPDVIRGILPERYRPVVRIPRFYGLSGRELGLEYRYQYRFVHKGQRFSDRFFAHLASIGREGPRTEYQTRYNDQLHNTLEVPDDVLYVDGPSVERWLAENDHAEAEQYTIYFVNWHGRDDFRFHVYTKTDEPDPDTGFNFGELLASRKMIAWGGSSGRSWLYDFSAGPEYWGGNYVVDPEIVGGVSRPADLDGDGSSDYVIPVIWEYVPGGYRPAFFLSLDMGFVARFVAINLLFTTSPLYDPLVTSPEPFGRKIAHLSLLEDAAAAADKGIGFIDPAFTRSRLRSLQPYYRWRVDLRNHDPIDDGARRAFDIFAGRSVEDDCWKLYGSTFAQLYCYFDAKLGTYLPPYQPRDYVAPVFAFNTTDLGSAFGLLGFADDNWVDGTQSYVFAFGSPDYRSFGFGFTSTAVHELGHHVGLSHPHDGYDPELPDGGDYGPSGFLFFAWLGDESDTVMHYTSVSNGFGRHDRDNMRRWETAGYLNWANALAGDILASPKRWKALVALRAADALAFRATRALGRFDYLEAVTDARRAYSLLAEAAREHGIASVSLAAARTALPGTRVVRDGCRPRMPETERPAKP